MDRVFEKSRPPSPGSAKFKRLLLGKPKKLQRSQPEYFPYGGGGDQLDDLSSQFDSYEPEELMVESQIPLKESSLHVLKRNARKILVSGSKYDIPDALAPPNSRNSSLDTNLRVSMPEPPRTPRIASHGPAPTVPSFDGFTVSGMSTHIYHWVKKVREVARMTVLLRPLDSLADIWSDTSSEYAIAAIELWLLMLTLSSAAQIVQIACMPSVWLLRMMLFAVT